MTKEIFEGMRGRDDLFEGVRRWCTPTNVLLLAALIGGMYFHVSVYALFLVGQGVPLGAVLMAQVFYSTASFLGEVPTGVLADRLGPKCAVVMGNVLEVLGLLMLLMAPSTEMVFFSYAVRGLSDSFISGAYDAWIYEVAAHSGQGYTALAARQRVLNLVGHAVSGVVAGVVVQVYGAAAFPWLFVGTILSVVTFTALVSLVPEYRVAPKGAVAQLWGGILLPTVQVFKASKIVRAVLVVLLLSLSGEFLLAGVYQPLFVQREVPAIWLGFGYSAGMVLQMAVTTVAVRLHRAWGFVTVQSGVTWMLGALFILLAVTTDPLVSVCAYVALVGMFNATEPLVGEYLHREVESSIRSTAISVVSCVRTAGQAAMRLLLGGAVGVISPVFALAFFGTYLLLGAAVGGYVLRRCGCVES